MRNLFSNYFCYEYKEFFKQYGWRDVIMHTLTKLDNSRIEREIPHLASPFHTNKAETGSLSIFMCARRLN